MTSDHRLYLLSAATILLWGIWGLFGKLALDKGMPSLSIFVAEILISAVCAGVVIGIFRSTSQALSAANWNVFGLISGLGLAIGLLCYYFALKEGRASVVVPLTSTYPAVTVLLSYGALNEKPSPMQWAGVVLVIVGVCLLLTGPVQTSTH